MSGLPMTRKQVLEAVKNPPQDGDFVWDGVDDDDKPLTPDEMKKGAIGFVNKGGRPKSANPKKSVTIRYTPEVIEYFKSTGKGWQTRMDKVLLEYVRSH